MARRRPLTCRVCGRHASEVGGISWNGYCREHGKAVRDANNDQISAGVGPFAEHRERRQLMAAHRRLLAMREREAS